MEAVNEHYLDIHAASFFAALASSTREYPLQETHCTVAVDTSEKENAWTIYHHIKEILAPEVTIDAFNRQLKRIKQVVEINSESNKKLKRELNCTIPILVCDECGNENQSKFMIDFVQGDTICLGNDASGCGYVVQDRLVFEGCSYRSFEGEEDRSHHGLPPNPLFSAQHQFQTHISCDIPSPLRQLSKDVDFNLSQLGKDDKRTRNGYKDRMVFAAVQLIDQICANFNLHELVSTRAKYSFKLIRTEREHIHKFNSVVAVCIIHAYQTTQDEMTWNRDGKVEKSADDSILHPFVCSYCDCRFNAMRGLRYHVCTVEKHSDNATSLKGKYLST